MEHKLNAAMKSLKRNQRVWIITGLCIIFISAVIATFLTAQGVANSAAKASTGETNAYLDDVTEAAQSSKDPQEIKTAVTAVEKPVFPEVPLGNISESYRMARTFHNEIIEKVDTFIEQVDTYAQLRAFNKNYQQLDTQLNQLNASNSTARYETLQEVNALIEKTKAPTDFADKFTEVGRIYTSMERNWEGMMTAQKMGNEQGYALLSQQYTQAAAQVPRVQGDVRSYVDQIDEKVESLVNELKRYKEGL